MSGVGSTASPYVVTALIPAVTPTVVNAGPGVSVTGAGTTGSPFVVSNTQVQSGDSLAAAVGCTTFPRAIAQGTSGAFSAGFPHFSGFVPQVSYTAANIAMFTTATTTPTSAYLGLYSVDVSGNLTQVAVTANTVALGTNALHKLPLITPVSLVAGQAYAVAFLTVGGNFNFATGAAGIWIGLVNNTIRPQHACYATAGGFTTLPASVLVAATTPYQFAMYAEITV